MRRYDIDWVRVIAIGLLIIYHAAISFQPWGTMIGFPTNKESWPALWLPMSLLNVWRIPLLFFVSGMGVYFAMRSRTPKELLLERSKRILVPYIFGIFVIVPIQIAIWRMQWMYVYNPAHLWFLGNIFAYVLIFVFVFYKLKLKTYPAFIAIVVFTAAMVAEVLIVKPLPYELYAMTWHGFFLGMIAFFFGYVFMAAGIEYWKMMWLLLIAAVVFFTLRITIHTPMYLIPVESVCWILFVLSIAHKYLNKESNVLKYLSEAAYPVYILHLVYQNLVSAFLFPMDLAVPIKYVLLVVLTLAGCFITYELIKRTNVTRFLFGLKPLRP